MPTVTVTLLYYAFFLEIGVKSERSISSIAAEANCLACVLQLITRPVKVYIIQQ